MYSMMVLLASGTWDATGFPLIKAQQEREPVSWGRPVDLHSLLPEYDDSCQPVRRLLRLAAEGETQEFALFSGPRLERVTSHGSIAFVGDASHALLGNFGSGASFALEDVYALARAVEWGHAKRRPLSDALDLFDSARSPLIVDGSTRSWTTSAPSRRRLRAENLSLDEEIAERIEKVMGKALGAFETRIAGSRTPSGSQERLPRQFLDHLIFAFRAVVVNRDHQPSSEMKDGRLLKGLPPSPQGRRPEHRVNDFSKEHLLCWLEVVHLLGKSAEAPGIIRLVLLLAEGAGANRQIQFVEDVRRLLFKFQQIIKQRPLQRPGRPAPTSPGPKRTSTGSATCSSFPDGARIASGSNVAAVRRWDAGSGKPSQIYSGEAAEKISAIAVSPDGRLLAGGSDDSFIMAWDAESGRLRYSFKAHEGWINSLSFSPDCQTLVSGSMDDTLAGVNSAVFSPDGNLLAVASVDKTLRALKISGHGGVTTTLDGHAGSVNSVRFSPDGGRVVSGSDDMTVRPWRLGQNRQEMVFRGHTGRVLGVDLSPGARLVASGSEDKSIRTWDLANGSQIAKLSDHPSGINAISFSPDGGLIASLTFDDEVRIWDTSTHQLNGKLDDFSHDSSTSDTPPAAVPYTPAAEPKPDAAYDLSGALESCYLSSVLG
ncbi:WD40 repeat-like protein [Colletotrichum falcatum]|nr:WD40 repeat-like protein [Colletotrichum falcatum]